ncbi:hypothetical protein Tco_1560987 [Tanacetum coccineum]
MPWRNLPLRDTQEVIPSFIAFPKKDFLVLSNPIDPQYHEKTTFTCPYGTCLQRMLLPLRSILEIRDKKGAENVAADHLSRLENPHKNELEKQNITESFPLESLGRFEAVKKINVNDNVIDENENVVENVVLKNVNVD